MPTTHPRRRDRRGRGVRGRLLTDQVPAWTTRSEAFDLVVLRAFAPIYKRWQARLGSVDIAVDDIPGVLPKDPAAVIWPPDVAADGAIPLARLIPAGVDTAGQPTRARIVLFRRPLEARGRRSSSPFDLDAGLIALVHEVLVQQVAAHLGVDEDTIDPA